jgi:hypothetical protein
MSIDFIEPWVRVGQFADNLVKELRREVVNGHALWNKGVRAIAQRTDTDDVLFEVEGVIPSYAVVHLTWSGESENDSIYPYARLFSSLDQWIREGMIPDHEEFVG